MSILVFIFIFYSSFLISPEYPPEKEKYLTESGIEEIKSPGAYVSEKEHHDIIMLPDLYFECHLAEINQGTRIQLFYDSTVRYYINLYFTERRNQIDPILERAEEYFPLFSRQLEKFDLPPELKYLPVLESALSSKAVSVSGAVGLWQFKKETGAYYGLRINNYLDEREDPVASTIAACRYLQELFRIFGDWHLTLMAYQAGQGTIKRAIKSAGGKTGYYDLYPFLPEQTKKYLPAYISMLYIFTNYRNH